MPTNCYQVTISSLIEFIKTILFLRVFFCFRPKKTLPLGAVFLIASNVLIFEIMDGKYIGILDSLIRMIIFCIFTKTPERGLSTAISIVLIDTYDVFIMFVATLIFGFDRLTIENNFLVSESFLLISLVVLIVLFTIEKTTGRKFTINAHGKVLFLHLLSIVNVQIYVTVLNALLVGDDLETHKMLLITVLFVCAVATIVLGVYHIRFQNIIAEEKVAYDAEKRILRSENEYFAMLLKMDESTRAFRHDIKGHLSILNHLVKEKRYDELEKYINKTESAIDSLRPVINTGSIYIDALLADFCREYPDINVSWEGNLNMLMDPVDMCTLFYNLLKNAFEAAEEAEEKNVKVEIGRYRNNLVIKMYNTYREIKTNKENSFISTKGEGHGYGIKNIAAIIKQYGGKCDFSTKCDVFESLIIFNDERE